MARADTYDVLLTDHRAAVKEFADKARAVDLATWFTPRAEGKWSPSQETAHLILAYEALTLDLLEGKTLRLRGTPFKRRLWRMIGMFNVLLRNKLYRGVTAPRELRPAPEPGPRDKMVPLFLKRVAEFEAAADFTRAKDPARTVTHPMMGALSLEHSLKFCAVHTRHHAGFLPAVAP